MKKNGAAETLSYEARSRLGDKRGNLFFQYAFSLAFGVMLSPAMIFKGSSGIIYWLGWVLIILTLIALATFTQLYRRAKLKILNNNREDYNHAMALKHMLNKLVEVDFSDFPESDAEIPGEWKPYRIEHHVSSTLRAQLHGYFSGFFGGEVDGEISGISTPDLLDDSVMLFLRAGDSTLRVIIPGPSRTKEYLSEFILNAAKKAEWGTHFYDVLENFVLTDQKINSLLGAPIIDALDAQICKGSNPEEYPRITVWGQMTQAGVAIASSLSYDDKRQVFFPSGFFNALAGKLATLLEVPNRTQLSGVV